MYFLQFILVGIIAIKLGDEAGLLGFITALLIFFVGQFFNLVRKIKVLIQKGVDLKNSNASTEYIDELYNKHKSRTAITVSYVSEEKIGQVSDIEDVPRYIILSNDKVYEYLKYIGKNYSPGDILPNQILLTSGLLYQDTEMNLKEFMETQIKNMLENSNE